MAFENLKNDAEQIQSNIKEVVATNVAYYKLWLFKIFMKSMTAVAKMFIIAAFFVFASVFISIALAIFLGDLLNNTILGFFIVGLFYFVLCIILFFAKLKKIEKLILQKFSEFFFNE